MNKLLTFTLLFTFSYSLAVSQEDSTWIDSLKIYAVSWHAKYRIGRTINNIKSTYIYYFQTDGDELHLMFSDYNDCIEKLPGQKEIVDIDTNDRPNVSCRSLVELYFGNRKVEIYFDSEGNYYFNKKWHIRNDGLYYLLFQYFSDEIVSEELLKKAKLNYKDPFWNPIPEK